MKINWKKQGLVYSPKFQGGWIDNSALTPTAFLLNDEIIRVYCGFRDTQGVSRIGYVDVSAEKPSIIRKVSERPCLDVGRPGMFDDNGVILGDIIRYDGEIRMYYVGFQLVEKAKFLAFSGLAVSTDNGESFSRVKEVPILDRSDEGKYIRAIHSVHVEDGLFRVWYATGNGWQKIGDKEYPQYDINYLESDDGINFIDRGEKVITVNKLKNEYRIGRPRVFKSGNQYIMNFTFGTLDGQYRAGQARSIDGKEWTRCDDDLGIELSADGWDSLHLSYPSIVTTSNDLTYMFYNGNNMGRDGFGYALLESIVVS